MVVKGDAQNILILFEIYDDYAHHARLHDACILKVFCKYFCPTYLKDEEHVSDYITSEGTRVHMRIAWEGGFPQRLMEVPLKYISGFMRMKYVLLN